MCYNVTTNKGLQEVKNMKANKKKNNYDTYIQFRVEKEVRENFNATCEKMDINGSDWLRSQIYKFVAMNK